MMDLFADDDDSSDDYSTSLTKPADMDEDEWMQWRYLTEGVDLHSIKALEKLSELNPDLLLPYILPVNEKLTDINEDPRDIFSQEGIRFMHLQMPNGLPSINKQLETNEYEKEDKFSTEKVYQSSKMECLPSGKIGKLRVYKSGKVKLNIGGQEFNVNHGMRSSCKQQVGLHLDKNNEFLFLGNFYHRLVVTPDVSDLDKKHYT